ncbi:hypothetical protein W97_04371 [Coniosporium apollinis CBS 100218]|uniref:Uncharacterized protein n=1 Tax=Coniosporium apollinis (strain CBS 100218) TaxID=1168221 RepID=R7YTK4_CONA1|nr:uncharacterized protein W97_04371 [Coniosporium apollinis CBS 100218]EON65134.1 hypothetical protein W97_04371 [Coniosporium apollinis CBS 100218]
MATTAPDIEFEDFSLVKDGLYVGAGSRENYDKIGMIFPGTRFVTWMTPFLVLVVEPLPPKPWPLRVGGAPLYITADPWSRGPYMGRLGQGKEILNEENAKGATISEDRLRRAANLLVLDLQIKVTTIDWYGCFWGITVPEGTPLTTLPCRLMDLMCRYKFTARPNLFDTSIPLDKAASEDEDCRDTAIPPTEYPDFDGLTIGDCVLRNHPICGSRPAVHLAYGLQLKAGSDMMAPHWQKRQLACFGNGLPGLVDGGGESTTQNQSRGGAASIVRFLEHADGISG